MKKYLYLILFFLVCVPAIAGTINSYTLKSPPDDADTIVIYDSDDGSTKKIQVGDISGSGAGINWDSYPDLTALTSAQEFLVNNAGTSSSINWATVQTQLPWTDDGTYIYNTTTSRNVGIGSTSPSESLDILKTVAGTGNMILRYPGALYIGEKTAFMVSDSSTATGVNLYTNNSKRFGVTNGGLIGFSASSNVGFGTYAPNSKVSIITSSGVPNLQISSSAGGDGDYLIVTSDGNIGINTLNPNQKMVINGNLRISDTDALYFGNNQYAFWVADAASNNGIRVYTNSVERFHINADGGIDINDNSTNGIIPLRVESDTDAYAFIVDGATDRIGIGTVSPISKLEVNGLIVPDKVTADPCTAGQEGALFYNDTSNYWCGCNGTDDVKLTDNTTACF